MHTYTITHVFVLNRFVTTQRIRVVKKICQKLGGHGQRGPGKSRTTTHALGEQDRQLESAYTVDADGVGRHRG
jgi:hypothetical protein